MVRIHVYTICWNEEDMLPYFLRHYEKFVDKIVVYDNGSTDRSRQIIEGHPLCELRERLSTLGNEDDLLWVKSESWREDIHGSSTPDWVIACDVDEFLFHKNVRGYLERCKRNGVTLPRTTGYEMVAEKFPVAAQELTKLCQRGFLRPLYAKRTVFNPRQIDSMNYFPGCHDQSPTGTIVEDDPGELILLHYGSVGRERMLARRSNLVKRNSAENKVRGFWRHHDASETEFHKTFDYFVSLAEPCLFIGWRGVQIYDLFRWGKRLIRQFCGLDSSRPAI